MSYDGINIGFTLNGKTSSKVLQPPGGESSDIFGTRTPNGGSSSNGSNTPTNGSTPSSRRGSRSEDTQNRLFGPVVENQRKVKDHLKSSIFGDIVDNGSEVKSAGKKSANIRRNPITGEIIVEPTALQNGNGHIALESNGLKTNGIQTIGSNGSISSSNSSLASSPASSVPSTPIRVRQPPGGRSSGIF